MVQHATFVALNRDKIQVPFNTFIYPDYYSDNDRIYLSISEQFFDLVKFNGIQEATEFINTVRNSMDSHRFDILENV